MLRNSSNKNSKNCKPYLKMKRNLTITQDPNMSSYNNHSAPSQAILKNRETATIKQRVI